MFGNAEYPKHKLQDVCTKITDGTHKTPSYQKKGITFISAKNIVNGQIDLSNVKYITEDEYNDMQRRCQTEKGDLLLSKSGTLGSVVVLDVDMPLGLFESLAVVKYDRTILNGIFLCEQIKSSEVQRQFVIGTKGVAVKHLHLNVIGATDIIVPPLELQNQFADFVSHVDKSKFAVMFALMKGISCGRALHCFG